MRYPVLTKERKSKSEIDAAASSEMDTPKDSEVQERSCLCVNCGKVFTKPVELTVHGKGSGDKYSACPHCFSRISSFYTKEASNTVEESVDEAVPEDHGTDLEEAEVSEEAEEPASVVDHAEPGGCACGHSVGYLKTLRKGTPTPEECFTCPSLIKCKY